MELEINIPQQVKDYLQIKQDILAKDLYVFLQDYRNRLHPDLYSSNDFVLQHTVTEKFKEANSLLTKLGTYIERESLNDQLNETNIDLYKKNNELPDIKTVLDLISKENEIKNLKSSNFLLEYDKKNLITELNALKDNSMQERTKELLEMFTPTKKGLISYSLIFILTIIFGVLTKIESISLIINKYWIFGENSFKILNLAVFIITPILYFIQLGKEKYVNNLAKKISTPYFINIFLNYLTNDISQLKREFSDLDIYLFLEKELFTQNFFMKTMRKYFLFNKDVLIDKLKDIFIYNLLKKQYITASESGELMQYFKMKIKNKTFPF